MDAAKARQKQHWSAIADAAFGDAYAHAVRGIGKAHARLGLAPQWYIGGYAIVVEQLIHAVVKDGRPSLLQHGRQRSNELASSLSSLIKAALLDIELSVSVYFDELEEKRRQEEAIRLQAAKEQEEALAALSEALAKLCSGDLQSRLTVNLAPGFEHLREDFNQTAAQLQRAFIGVADCTPAIKQATEEIFQAAEDLSRRTETQAASLEETAAALTQITATVQETSKSADHAHEVVSTAKAGTEHGGQIVVRAVEAMSRIEKSSKDISRIIGVIDEIAFQTNLLALNAGVEAARAGTAGRGFAVVASEVRGLAQRSAEAAKEIKVLISASTHEVADGVALVGESGKSLEAIVGEVTELAQVVANIAAGAKEQASALRQVNQAVAHMDQATQQNAAMVEETTAALMGLREQADDLAKTVAVFNVGELMDNGAANHRPRPQDDLWSRQVRPAQKG